MERLIFLESEHSEGSELRIGSLPAAAGVLQPPTARDLAMAISSTTLEWFESFLLHLSECHNNRAISVAKDLEAPAHFHGKLSRATTQDLLGGDIDPGSGVCPEDSGRLLELRQVIDAYLGWPDQESEEAGDYVNRIRNIGDGLYNLARALGDICDPSLARGILRSLIKYNDTEKSAALDAGDVTQKTVEFIQKSKVAELKRTIASYRKRLNNQRKELKRFNNYERLRTAGGAAMKVHLMATETLLTVRRALERIKSHPSARFTERAHADLVEKLTQYLGDDT